MIIKVAASPPHQDCWIEEDFEDCQGAPVRAGSGRYPQGHLTGDFVLTPDGGVVLDVEVPVENVERFTKYVREHGAATVSLSGKKYCVQVTS